MLNGLLPSLPTSPPPDRTWQLEFEGYHLHVQEYGRIGDPVLVYLHGLLLSSSVNRGVAAALADKGQRVVLLDLLGHGLSEKPPLAALYRFDTFPAQVIALLDALGVEQAAIGGVSLGANASLWTAVQHPDRVSAMVVEMPVLEYGTPAAYVMFIPLMLAAHYVHPVVGAFSWAVRQTPMSHSWVDGFRDAAAQQPAVMAAVLHGLLVGPIAPTREERHAVTTPTLVLTHSRDVLHPLDDARALHRDLPRSKLLRAHSPAELRTHPARLTQEVAEFLRAPDAVAPAA